MGRKKPKQLAAQKRAETSKSTNPYKPNAGKRVPPVSDPPSNDGELFQWSVNSLDHKHDDEWNWDLEPVELHKVLSLMCELSKLTWSEVRNQTYNGKRGARRHKNKYQPTDTVCDKAKGRLGEIEVETEQLFRLRLNSNARVWGYVQRSTFQVIWYDRDHRVCPIDN